MKQGLFSQYKGLKRENYVLFFGRLVTGLGSMVWSMMTLILTSKLGYSATEASVLMIIAGIFMLPVNLLGGVLADRFNKKKVIIVCDLISVSLYVLCALVPLGVGSLVLIFAAAAGQTLEHPAYSGIIADITPTRDRERAYSLQYLGMNLGLVAAPTIAGILFQRYLWLSFLISGTSIFLSTILIAVLVRDITPVQEGAEEAAYQQGHEEDSLFKVLKANGALVLYLLVVTVYSGSYMQYNYLMPMDLMARHGDIGSVIYGTLSSTNCILCVVLTPLITRYFTHRTTVQKTLTALLLMMVGYALFLLPLKMIPLYYVAMTLFTVSEIFNTVANGPHLTERVPAAHRGRINAFHSVLTNASYSLCMFITGRLYDASGNSMLSWMFVLAFLALGVAMMPMLFRADRKRYPKLYAGDGKKEE